jgi:hypothetical protein
MKNKILIFLAFFSMLGIFTSCEEDGEKVYFGDAVPPTLVTMPDLDLKRANANDTLVFIGTLAEINFPASINYTLETCVSGNGFEDDIEIISGVQDTLLKVSIGDLNSDLIRELPEFSTTSMDFRIRARLVVDAGKGAPGTPADPFEYMSNVITQDITTYGLPRMDLLNSGIEQSLKSATEGIYSGLVKLDLGMDFTFFDPETGTTYGGSSGDLVADGAAISPDFDGWHKIEVNLNDMSYEVDQYSVGIVGEFTGWGGSSDIFMEYDPEEEFWHVTTDLPTGPMKFRLNSDWAVNWGPGTTTDLPADGGEIELPNAGGDIVITTAGNYTIELTIDGSAATADFDLN